jgi:hypothetical protein
LGFSPVASRKRDHLLTERRISIGDGISIHGFGFHQDQDVRPAGPTLAECRPEQSVPGVQFWPRPFSFQHGYLLSEGEDFEGGIASTAPEHSHGHKEKKIVLESTNSSFLTRRNVASPADAAKSQVAHFKPITVFCLPNGRLSLEMQFRSAHRHFVKAIIPYIPLTTDLKNGHEESVN